MDKNQKAELVAHAITTELEDYLITTKSEFEPMKSIVLDGLIPLVRELTEVQEGAKIEIIGNAPEGEERRGIVIRHYFPIGTKAIVTKIETDDKGWTTYDIEGDKEGRVLSQTIGREHFKVLKE